MLSLFCRSEFRSIFYCMFDNELFGLVVKNVKVLERVYYKGYKYVWDGKEVLDNLVAQYGMLTLFEDMVIVLSCVFGLIMWGELVAWCISVELADEIELLEVKMVVISQVFDEVWYFYVMYDYLELLGVLVDRLDWGVRCLFEEVMNVDYLVKKLVGMQFMVEFVVLILFYVVKVLDVELVLSYLLFYYECDELWHVVLGVQYLLAMFT